MATALKRRSTPPLRHPEEHAEQIKRIEFVQRNGLTDELPELQAELERIDQSDPVLPVPLSPHVQARRHALESLGIDFSKVDPLALQPILDTVLGDGDVWQDRYAREKAVDPERQISTLVDRWTTIKLDEVEAGRSPMVPTTFG
ncbi:MAG: hypothetical protein U0736_25555 [Gemmataceae bacterium]